MRLWNRLLASCAAVLLLGFIAGAAHATSTGGPPGSGSRCHFCFDRPAGSVDPDALRIAFFDHAEFFDTTCLGGEQPGNDYGLGQLGWGLLHELGEHGDPQGNMLALLENGWGGYRGCLRGLGWGQVCDGQFPFPFDEGWIKPREGCEIEFGCRGKRFNVVPEPATAALLGLGLFGLAVAGRRL